MTMPDPDAKFLLDGLRYFPDAHATVTAYRRVLTKKVERVLGASNAVWSINEVKPTRAESNGLWAGACGQMELAALAGKKLTLDVGILWGASHFKEPAMAVAGVYGATVTLGHRLEDPVEVGIQFVRVGSQDLFALALGDDTTDVEESFRRVVAAAAKSVALATSLVRAST